MPRTEVVESQPFAMSAEELVAQGTALVRAQNDQMVMIAAQQPREIKKVSARSLEELEAFPDLAAECYYSIPYKDNQTGKVHNVEGPSIQAATALARIWGNCVMTGRYESISEDSATVTGVFMDLETNVRFEMPLRITRYQKQKGSNSAYLLPEERWVMRMQAGLSKAVRNAILKGLPKPLITTYTEKAKALGRRKFSNRGKRKGSVGDKIREAFLQFGVKEDLLLFLTQVDDLDKVSNDDKEYLAGVINALKDKQTTAEELYRQMKETQEAAETSDDAFGTVSAEASFDLSDQGGDGGEAEGSEGKDKEEAAEKPKRSRRRAPTKR